jgi:methyltransferase
MLSREAFTALVLLVALQRLWETIHSRAHGRALLREQAVEYARGQMPWMVLLHGAWLVAMIAEVWWRDPAPPVWSSGLALLVFGAGQALRIAAMRALGERWTVNVVTPTDGRPPVGDGIYGHIRHPNYLGVALEVAALPCVGGAYLSAIVFSVLNGALLSARIRAEEAALDRHGPYHATLGDRPRFLPFRRSQRS